MKPTTDIEQVKSVARALLMTEVYKTPYSPMVVQHPFTSSGFVATTKDGVMQLIDITESEENLQAWQSFMRKQINSTDNAYEIYMMTNKPYSLTFLKYASPYLSKADFSKILADAWIRSENPNCDTNVSKSKLISMFKQADPHELMLEDELLQYEELDDTVTVYRGVTSHNAKNIKALPSVIVSTMKGIVAESENKQGRALFKLAVEMAIMMNLIAAKSDVDELMLERLRGACVAEVKRLNGNFTFEDALNWQKG